MDERGSAVVEFTLVTVLLTVLALAVVQLALGLHVRNTLLDAAAEGARYASLLGSGPEAGAERTRVLIGTAIAPGFADEVRATTTTLDGLPVVAVTVRAPLPIIGLLGPSHALEVTGHAAVESLG